MPFAGYKDFQDCVDRNRDKADPKAYCAEIMIRAGEARTRRKSRTVSLKEQEKKR